MSGPDERLSAEAYAVADEYRDGRWSELRGKEWGEAWRFLVDELKRRCPGATVAECERALGRGFTDSR